MCARFVAASLALLTLSCGGARAELAGERERLPCDPASDEHPVEVAYEQRLAGACGDGRRGQHVISCVERCSFGCGTERRCSDRRPHADRSRRLRAAVFDPDGEGSEPRRFVLGVVR